MDCFICFCEEDEVIFCQNNKCEYIYCLDCCKRLIEISEKEKVIPSCSCGEPFYESQIRSISKEYADKYINLLYLCLSKEDREIKEYNGITEILVKKLQKEKMDYMKVFPICISMTVLYTSEKKMLKIDKEQLKKTLIGKKCSDIFCSGRLDSITNSCSKCRVKFCEKCNEVSPKGHVCDKNILDNLKLIEEQTKCPKCSVPIMKNGGCDYMTCPVCSTKFCYSTGEVSEFGNHSDLRIKINPDLEVDEYFKGVNDILGYYTPDIVSDIEMILEIRSSKETTMKKVLRHTEKKSMRLGEIFESYRRGLNKKIICNKVLGLIVVSHKSDKLDSEFIKDTLYNLKSTLLPRTKN
jgi:hypothetical protein